MGSSNIVCTDTRQLSANYCLSTLQRWRIQTPEKSKHDPEGRKTDIGGMEDRRIKRTILNLSASKKKSCNCEYMSTNCN